MTHLETQLKRAADKRFKLIATDGVFSMDGDVAVLGDICDLADKYGAWVMVDDSHATGFFGPTGRGSIEYRQVMDRVDIVTSTFGKALGGASGRIHQWPQGNRRVIEAEVASLPVFQLPVTGHRGGNAESHRYDRIQRPSSGEETTGQYRLFQGKDH